MKRVKRFLFASMIEHLSTPVFSAPPTDNKVAPSPELPREHTRFAEELAGQLSEEHLDRLADTGPLRFELPPVVVANIGEEVRNRLRLETSRMIRELREEFEDLPGAAASEGVGELDERRIWEDLQRNSGIESGMVVELPRPEGPLRWLQDARRFTVPVILMLGSILTNLFFMVFWSLRDGIDYELTGMTSLGGIMIAGMVLGFRKRGELDREIRGRGLVLMRERVRDAVLREIDRVEVEKRKLIEGFVARAS